jgi:hypothetical protein
VSYLVRKIQPAGVYRDLRTISEVRDWLRARDYEPKGDTVIDMLNFALIEAYQRGVQRAVSLKPKWGDE